MKIVDTYKEDFISYLQKEVTVKEPENLYAPIHYILQIGGKRLRPILTIMTCDLFEGKPKAAYNAALAIELFHNFTLIHDDIMDSAPIRRGKVTVHEKWDINTGILSGDAMMILASQCFNKYEPALFKKLTLLFNSIYGIAMRVIVKIMRRYTTMEKNSYFSYYTYYSFYYY